MTRWVIGPILLALVAGTALGLGSALETREGVRGVSGKLEPYSDRSYWRKFDGGRKAEVVAVGEGAGLLGLYVFDAHGNCVAHDDDVSARTADDAAVQWMPAHTGLYTIDVRSLGSHKNPFVMTVSQASTAGGAMEK